MSSSLSTVAYIYKNLYSDKQVGDMAMRDHPTLAMCDKQSGFTGKQYNYAWRYGNPQGVSGDFATAQTGSATSKGEQPVAVRKKKYGVIDLDGESMSACDTKGSFLDLVTQETDGIIEELGDSLAFDLQRSGNGIRGQRLSASTNVITMYSQDEVRNFKVGMTVRASSNIDGVTGLRVGSTTVASVDQSSSTITLTSAAGITSFADDDYLFRAGDPGTCMDGLELQFPLTAPTAGDSFRGVDRSVFVELLSGVRVADTGTSIEENAGLVAVKIAQNGKRADCLALNPIRYWEVVRRLNAKVEYDDGGGSANFGFEYFKIHTPAGTLKCYSDPDVPTNRGRVLNKASLYIKHLEAFTHVIRQDGLASLRQAAADGVEARVRSMGNLICTVPGANGVFSI